MNRPVRLPAVIVLCLGCACSAASAAPREAPSLLHAVTLWLVANFDLAIPAELPPLVSVPDADLIALRYGPDADVVPGEVVALYDDRSRTIYLSEHWTGRTPAELSVLVHEMVHHLQSVSGMRFACPAEREVLAYHAQDAWLGLFGESLESAFGLDAAKLLVSGVCTH